MMRTRSLTSEIRDRAVAYVDRRGGAAMRRGGRGRGSQRTKDKFLYALSNLSAANYYATQSGGGEPGDAAGFGEAVMWITTSLAPTAAEMLVDRYSSNTGHCLYTQSGVDVFGAFGTGSTTVSTPSHRLTATDVGRIQVAASYWDGTKARLWTRRAQQGDGTALASYAPFSGATAIGSRRGGLPAVNQQILSVVQWRGVPTQAALEAFFDEARRLGELPAKLQGCTVTHKWPDPKLLKSLVAPATTPDVITGASADAMGKTGAPTVAVIDTTRDGRRLLGAQGFSPVNYLQAQTAGIRGSAGGLWFAVLMRPDAAMASGKHVVNCYNAPSANSGYALAEAANALNLSAFNGAGSFVGAVVSIPTTSADIGQPLPVLVNFDGSTWTAYARDGSQVATAAGSLKPNTTTPMRVGLRADTSAEPLDNASFFQLMGGDVALTPTEIAQVFADYKATGRFVRAPKAEHFYDPTQDFSPTERVTAIVQDRVGTDHLTTNGTGLTLAQRTERVWSYETTPILSGAQTFSPSDYLTHPDALRASTGDWHFLLFWWLLSQQTSMGSASRVLLGDGVSGAGWGCYTSGFNSSLILYGTSAAGANVNAPVVTLPAADVGKLHVTAGGYDATAGKLRLFHKRVEQGTGSAISGFLPGSSPSYVGRSAGGQPSNTGLAIVGWSFGQTPLSLAEYQAACDAIMAGEDIVSAPGRTQGLWSLKQDRIDTSATVQDRVGSKHFSRVGQPTLASAYARAWSW